MGWGGGRVGHRGSGVGAGKREEVLRLTAKHPRPCFNHTIQSKRTGLENEDKSGESLVKSYCKRPPFNGSTNNTLTETTPRAASLGEGPGKYRSRTVKDRFRTDPGSGL